MTTDQDKAVALAEKHGAVIGVRHATVTSGDGILFTPEELTAMLAERDQQHSEELANTAVVMPEIISIFGNGYPKQGLKVMRAEDCKDAFATMQAKVEQLEEAVQAASAYTIYMDKTDAKIVDTAMKGEQP